MYDRRDGGGTEGQYGGSPTPRQRVSLKHTIEALLDALAPERAAAAAARPTATTLQRYRSPRGCILQGPAAAVSVSWFPDATGGPALGELQIVAWRGIVSHPGSAHRSAGGAVAAQELVLHPVERMPEVWAWSAVDGTLYGTDALAAHCLAMLEEQTAKS